MAVRNRQIGWSPMANALYDVLREVNALKGQFALTTTTTTAIPNLTLKIDNSPNFDIPDFAVDPTNSDFTIEWWAYMNVDDNHPRAWSIGSWPNAAHAVSIENGSLYYWIGGTIMTTLTLTQPYIGQWSYFTITRYKEAIGIFQNGFLLGNVTYGGAIPTNGFPLYLGSEGNDSVHKGNMSNFRWTSSNVYVPFIGFTPPTTPLTVLPETKLLIFQGTRLVDEIIDQSGNGYRITNATGFYNSSNPFIGEFGSIDFGNIVGFTFKANNSAGNIGGTGTGIGITGSLNFDVYVNWGDESGLEYYYPSSFYEINHTYTSNSIFDVTVYMKDPTNITSILNDSDKGNFHLLEVDYSKLQNISYVSLYGNELPSTQVNKLLNDLVVNGFFGGVLFVQSQTPPAPPTGQGIVDVGLLNSSGWSVTTD